MQYAEISVAPRGDSQRLPAATNVIGEQSSAASDGRTKCSFAQVGRRPTLSSKAGVAVLLVVASITPLELAVFSCWLVPRRLRNGSNRPKAAMRDSIHIFQIAAIRL
jgi:hypothetical protein